MRRVLLVLALVVVPCLAAAQAPFGSGGRGSWPGCPTCGVWSWVDFPEDQQTVKATFRVDGWGFECVSGQPIDRVDVQYQDYDGNWQFAKQPEFSLQYGVHARPDVLAFGRAVGCQNTALHSGWTLRVSGIPAGLRRVRFTVWYGPYLEGHTRTYLIRK